MARAAVALTGWDEDTLYACASTIGDLGEAIGLLRPPVEPRITIAEAEAFFRTLSRTRKPADKRALLEALLSRAGPAETKYLLKTLTGSMRVGADLATLEEAIAAAFGEPRETVARARRDSGDIGETAAAARAHRLEEVAFRLFHPIGFMLASRRDAEDTKRSFPPSPWDKFDGIRGHAHKDGARVALFSRTPGRHHRQFPDVAAALAAGPAAPADARSSRGVRTARRLLQLQKRLGARAEEEVLARSRRFIAYDCLALDGEGLFEKPWSERRADSRRSTPPIGLRLSEVSRAETAGGSRGFSRGPARGTRGSFSSRRTRPTRPQAGRA